MEKNQSWWLIKIDRAGAWILMLAVILFFATSYGMEKGIFDRQAAKWLHTEILPVIGMIGFTMHTSLAVRMSLMRWRWWNKVSKIGLIGIYGILAAAFAYFAYFYDASGQTASPASSATDSAAANSQNTASDNPATPTEDINQNTADDTIFTVTELAKYNGQNGTAAYIAVDGTVYDVSTLFINGQHHGCRAGTDATAEFYDEHSKSILKGYPVVGTYQAANN